MYVLITPTGRGSVYTAPDEAYAGTHPLTSFEVQGHSSYCVDESIRRAGFRRCSDWRRFDAFDVAEVVAQRPVRRRSWLARRARAVVGAL